MLDEWPEANNQLFTWREVFFQSHPRARPVVQIAAVDGSIGGQHRGSSAVYSGSLRLENRPCHGTDHHSKPLSSPSGIRLPTRSLRPRQEKHRSGRATAGGLGGQRNLLNLSSGVRPYPFQDNAATIYTIANAGAMLI